MMTEMMKLTDKDLKRFIVNMFNDLKKDSMNTMGNMENCNKTTKRNF